MIDPRGMSLRDWADSVIIAVNDAWAFGKLGKDEDWQNWGVAFLKANGFSQRNAPDPYAFTDWKEWAMRVYPMLEGNV